MKDRFEIPRFASEEEEANWWFDNREKMDEEFLKAGLGAIRRPKANGTRGH
jgi:hypothetical protein